VVHSRSCLNLTPTFSNGIGIESGAQQLLIDTVVCRRSWQRPWPVCDRKPLVSSFFLEANCGLKNQIVLGDTMQTQLISALRRLFVFVYGLFSNPQMVRLVVVVIVVGLALATLAVPALSALADGIAGGGGGGISVRFP
jgi:hypothetical protein